MGCVIEGENERSPDSDTGPLYTRPMADAPMSFFLLVPGPWESTEAVTALLSTIGSGVVSLGSELGEEAIGVEVVEDSDGFADALSYMPGLITDAEIAACGQTHRAVVIEVEGTLDARREIVGELCAILHGHGGLAIRFEASSKAHSLPETVRALASGDIAELLQVALVFSFDGEQYFSIGMHQFNLPDVEVSGVTEEEAGYWLFTFTAYTLEDDPIFADGHTFGVDPDAPRQYLERWPDTRHHGDDGRQNPYGLWRVLPPGVEGLPVLDPEPTYIPSLSSMLLSKERELGRPLTEAEVVEIADTSVAMAVNIKDARTMERARGYADISGRRAWEQWQIIRQWMS